MTSPLQIWQEKRLYLEQQLAIISDATQKFALRKQIEECNKEIKRLSIFEIIEINHKPASPPVEPPLFIGRDEDLYSIKEKLGIVTSKERPSSIQLLTAVRGWPGVGKTAIATVLSRDLDIEKAFPDGVLWTSLGQEPNILTEMATWGRALGTDELLCVPTLKKVTFLLTSLLKNKRMLLIVDDIWEIEHVIPFKQAKGKDCALLMTTRLPSVADGLELPSNAIYNLPVLTEDRAFELLSILAPSVTKLHPRECRELVRDIECLPLALHVAGQLLNTEEKKGWGVTDLLKELKEGAKIINSKAPNDLIDLEKQTIPTVATLFQKSTARLDEQIRDCFAFLGPFAPKPATFDLDAMKAVWLVDDPKPIARILIDHGLLEPLGSGRFQMHALLVSHAKSFLV